MTFATLAKKIRMRGLPGGIDIIEILREAENDFIRQTLCTETFIEIDTSTENDSELTNLYDLPDGFVEEHRVEWDGGLLKPHPQGSDVVIYNTNNELRSGYVSHYWIQNEDIQLILKPSMHSIIGVWYTGENMDTDSTSPTIPSKEQIKLLNYVRAVLWREELGDFNKAAVYQTFYDKDVAETKKKYFKERHKQGRIIDVTATDDRFSLRRGGGASITVDEVNIVDQYIWKKVQLSNTDAIPPTEETFSIGSGQLTLALLDTPQKAFMTFNSSHTYLIEIMAAYQDRKCFLSTAPSVSDGVLSFGLTLSEAGVTGACYYDLRLVISK